MALKAALRAVLGTAWHTKAEEFLDLIASDGSGAANEVPSITATDASLDIRGLEAAQGGSVNLIGGTSTTAANAGGALTRTGGTPGATGVGGAVSDVGGASAAVAAGATAAAGGAVGQTGGAGGTTATGIGGAGGVNADAGGAGGAATGAGVGGAGGSAVRTGGVGGATTTSTGGAGGIAGSTGGAGGAASGAGTGGKGGSTVQTAGAGGTAAGGTAGKDGSNINRGLALTRKQGAPTAKTVTAGLSAAELLTGIITTTGATGPSVHQLPTGTALLAEVPDFIAGDSFDFAIINTGTGAATDATITVNTDVTIVGSPTVGSLVDNTVDVGSGLFRARYTGGVTWIVYRIG